MTALSNHQGKYGKPCPLRQSESEEVSSPTLASSSLSSTCSFLLYPQGLSSGCQPGERRDGQDTKPDILPTWSHLSLSGAFPLVHNNRRQEAIPLRPPETSEPLTASQGPYFRSSPPPRVSPFPGVSRPSGPLPAVSPTPVPISGPLGAHTGSWALTSPAAGGARVTAAGASAGSARKTDPHSPAGRPGPRAGSDVRVACRRRPSGSAHE